MSRRLLLASLVAGLLLAEQTLAQNNSHHLSTGVIVAIVIGKYHLSLKSEVFDAKSGRSISLRGSGTAQNRNNHLSRQVVSAAVTSTTRADATRIRRS